MIVYDLDIPPPVPLQRIRSVFGLTGAEAIVAAGVMQGRSLHDIADLQGNTVVTVRNLLKRIFAKTGAQRQSELCAMLLRAPVQIDIDALSQRAKALQYPSHGH